MPVHINSETLNRAILLKSGWLHKQVRKSIDLKASPLKSDTRKIYMQGGKILFKGKFYPLHVQYREKGNVCLINDSHIKLSVRPASTAFQREKIVYDRFRKELRQSIEQKIANWQPVMGVKVNEFGVRQMKTRWGSCNITAKRIWLNFELIKLADHFLEYVIVHEMVHLLERKHNARFRGLMDQFMPEWRKLKEELDAFSL